MTLGSSAARRETNFLAHVRSAAILGAFLLLPAAATARTLPAAPSGATITFRKIFKSSYPEFVEIKVTESGAGTYDIRQLSDDPSSQPMKVDSSLVQKIFALAAKLHDFDGIDLEMHRRIANLGQKTFQYQLGAETHTVSFNYTQNPNASQLLDIFESLARQQTDLSDLRRAMRYDRLGVNECSSRFKRTTTATSSSNPKSSSPPWISLPPTTISSTLPAKKLTISPPVSALPADRPLQATQFQRRAYGHSFRSFSF